jgi:ABC-type sugar transport system substrate-binding protein
MKVHQMLLASVAVLSVALPASAIADTSDKRIALSNNYAGNSWRQAMLTSWETVTGEAVSAGIVAAADAFTTAENQATEQAAQIQNMILQGYDAIVLNAASPTALNGAVKEACDAGITVVSFDGIVTEPCAWRIAVDFKEMGRSEVEYLAQKMPDGGNLLEIRGLAGVFVDDEISAGIHAGVEQYPQFKVVGSVHGDWAQDVAQKAVAGILPSLPEIKAVVTQGGDGYGAAQAVPGPLLSFAGYLGAVLAVGPGGVAGAAVALLAIFAPSFLLICGALPFWDRLRAAPAIRAPLRGVNAGVVGLLLAALIHPVATSAIEAPPDAVLAVAGLAMLVVRWPAWLVVMVIGLAGALLAVF